MQNQQNPDVNSTVVDDDYPGQPDSENIEVPSDDVEREPIPLPPDVENPYPVVDPPLDDDVPLGDVDDSPKIIADAN